MPKPARIPSALLSSIGELGQQLLRWGHEFSESSLVMWPLSWPHPKSCPLEERQDGDRILLSSREGSKGNEKMGRAVEILESVLRGWDKGAYKTPIHITLEETTLGGSFLLSPMESSAPLESTQTPRINSHAFSRTQQLVLNSYLAAILPLSHRYQASDLEGFSDVVG